MFGSPQEALLCRIQGARGDAAWNPASGGENRCPVRWIPSASIRLHPPGFDQTWDLSGLQVQATQEFIYRPAAEGLVEAQILGADLVMTPSQDPAEYYYDVTATDFALQAYYGVEPYSIIASHLPQAGPVRLVVFDLAGRRDRRLRSANAGLAGVVVVRLGQDGSWSSVDAARAVSTFVV